MPRRSLLRRFVPCLLLSLMVIAPHPAGAIEVKVKGGFHCGGLHYSSITQPEKTPFPFAVYLPTPAAKDQNGPWSFDDSDLPAPARDVTALHIVGEIHLGEGKPLRINRSDRPKPMLDLYGPAFECLYYRGAPIKNWDDFLLLLDDVLRNQTSTNYFVVTFGEEPAPESAPQWQLRSGNPAPGDGRQMYAHEVPNPLPGIRFMRFCDFRPAAVDR